MKNVTEMDQTTKNKLRDVHRCNIPPGYKVNPLAHLKNSRDRTHYLWTLGELLPDKTSILDIGPWDGWLDFLLIMNGFSVCGVEIDSSLATVANRYAAANNIPYSCYNGFLSDFLESGEFTTKYSAAIAYEVLEHIPYEHVPHFVNMMLKTSNCLLFSLPDQCHTKNNQHLWTPTLAKIHSLFPGAKIEYITYNSNAIPNNWLIRYDAS